MFDKSVDVLWHLTVPLQFLFLSGLYIPVTIFKLATTGQLSTLMSPASFKDAWFATFWNDFGPTTKEMAKSDAMPLISLASGIVLDIGPGSGEWLPFFDKSRVTKIYGVEPNRDQHNRLRQRIKEAGLSDVYEIVPVGVEDLGTQGIEKGSVDTVVTVQCLCSVSSPEAMITDLYGYLRQGGQWIVYEHVITKQEGLVSRYQAAIDVFWPHFLGGCSIRRDTEKSLRESGVWSKIDLKQPQAEPTYTVIPHVMGTLVK